MSDTRTITASIAVCTHNRAEMLLRCLETLGESIDACGGEGLEVLVIDNASTDDTSAKAGLWCARQSARRIVREERLGVSHARNRAVDCSNSDWIVYLDDDTEIPLDFAERLKSALQAAEEGSFDLIGGLSSDPPQSQQPPAWVPEGAVSHGVAMNARLDSSKRFQEMPQGSFVIGYCFAVRPEVVRRVGGFDARLGPKGKKQKYGDETDLQLRIQKAGLRVAIAPDLLVLHLERQEKYTARYHFAGLIAAGRSNVRLWPEKSVSRQISSRIRSSAFHARTLLTTRPTRKDTLRRVFAILDPLVESVGLVLGKAEVMLGRE